MRRERPPQPLRAGDWGYEVGKIEACLRPFPFGKGLGRPVVVPTRGSVFEEVELPLAGASCWQLELRRLDRAATR